jgi:alkylated DNA nucleotide flippase Atl1
MSDAVTIAIVTGCVTAFPIMLGQVLTYLGSQRQRAKVARQANEKMDVLAKQADEIHRVVNSQNTALITKNVELATRVSQIEQDKADIIRVAAAGPIDVSGQTGK